MTEQMQENTKEVQENSKEYNFRMLEAKYEKRLEEERRAREQDKVEFQKTLEELKNSRYEEDNEDEPYVDNKKLEKKLAHFGEQTKKQTQTEINNAVQTALREEKRQNWLKQNPDFSDVLKHAEKLAEKDPELAETILQMPDPFERQKLAYKTIKSMRLHEPTPKEIPVQDRINQNKRNLYYQPSDVATAPYSTVGDFSPAGQKQAYEKMQELKKGLRI